MAKKRSAGRTQPDPFGFGVMWTLPPHNEVDGDAVSEHRKEENAEVVVLTGVLERQAEHVGRNVRAIGERNSNGSDPPSRKG